MHYRNYNDVHYMLASFFHYQVQVLITNIQSNSFFPANIAF